MCFFKLLRESLVSSCLCGSRPEKNAACIDGSQRKCLAKVDQRRVSIWTEKPLLPKRWLKRCVVLAPGAEILEASRTRKAMQMSLQLLLQACGRGQHRRILIQEKHPLQPTGFARETAGGWRNMNLLPHPSQRVWFSNYLANILLHNNFVKISFLPVGESEIPLRIWK